MRRRRSFSDDWYHPPPKQPVPADGIAAERFGATWWGREWMAALERLGGSWANRLPRGRSYARQGRVVDLTVGAGAITAGVVGSRRRPYRVTITLPALGEAAWRCGVEELADDALLVIRLLERELPGEVGERLRAVGVELFPTRRELATGCSCPDLANPCKHVAAVHYLFAAALDNDPFLLFRLRGLDRPGLLAALAGARDLGGPPSAPEPDRDQSAGELEDAGAMDAAAFLGHGRALPLVDLEPRAPRVELVGLRRLGPPPRGLEGLPEVLARAVRAGGRRALELAWSDPAAVAPEPAVTEQPRRREGGSEPQPPIGTSASPAGGGPAPPPLALRLEAVLEAALRPLSRRELAAELGEEAAVVSAALKRLRTAGLVSARGRGPSTRYVLAARPAPARRPGAAGGDLPGRVVEELRSARGGQSLRSLADRLGLPPEQLRPVLLALRQNGVVEMVGRRRGARYRLRADG